MDMRDYTILHLDTK